MLTISQLASYAGVTVRAVRHYHAKGLLPEPERDHSGYRRYDAAAVVDLIRIRTLAEAGVPLSRVKELLAASGDEFAAAVKDIDKRLRAEIRERQRSRERIAQLAAGDSLALPPEVVAYLDRLRALGLSERLVEGERDAWILVAAQLPDQMATMMALKSAQLDQPEVIDLYRQMDDAIDWGPDDPRLPELVDTLVTAIEQEVTDPGWEENAEALGITDELVDLLDTVFVTSVPIAPRLLELLEERGWTGWTNLRRGGLVTWTFTAELWLSDAEGAWVFVALPPDVTEDVRLLSGPRPGFGSVRVEVTVGGTTWQTSVFPDRARGYLLPVKAAVRRAEGLDVGDHVDVDVRLADR